ncbi:MAG: hypothetical protein MUF34_37590 [Polyangiaceae bacterium]|nr:hypothetical protein [Polyangiaceae bacterium]
MTKVAREVASRSAEPGFRKGKLPVNVALPAAAGVTSTTFGPFSQMTSHQVLLPLHSGARGTSPRAWPFVPPSSIVRANPGSAPSRVTRYVTL